MHATKTVYKHATAEELLEFVAHEAGPVGASAPGVEALEEDGQMGLHDAVERGGLGLATAVRGPPRALGRCGDKHADRGPQDSGHGGVIGQRIEPRYVLAMMYRRRRVSTWVIRNQQAVRRDASHPPSSP